MKGISLLARCTIVTVLVALVLSSFPTVNVLAKGNNQGLEDKWDQLVTNYARQSIRHNSVHKWADHWFKTTDTTSSEKAEVTRYLTVCDSAIASAGTIAAKQAGFDAGGNVIDRGAAQKSIKDLAYYLQQHAGSVKKLEEDINH